MADTLPLDFKKLLKAFRLRAGFGLRRFAEFVGESPSNYAGVESGQRPPWRTVEKLRRVADALGLREGTTDWDVFFLAAKKCVGLPPDVEHILERPLIPALLRTVDSMRLSDEELRALIEEGVFKEAIEKLRKKKGKSNGNPRGTH